MDKKHKLEKKRLLDEIKILRMKKYKIISDRFKNIK